MYQLGSHNTAQWGYILFFGASVCLPQLFYLRFSRRISVVFVFHFLTDGFSKCFVLLFFLPAGNQEDTQSDQCQRTQFAKRFLHMQFPSYPIDKKSCLYHNKENHLHV